MNKGSGPAQLPGEYVLTGVSLAAERPFGHGPLDVVLDLLIRTITVSIDLMKDWNQFIEQITYFLREVCPQNQMVQDGMNLAVVPHAVPSTVDTC